MPGPELRRCALRIAPGDGLVSRSDRSVLLLCDPEHPAADGLLAAAAGTTSGRALVLAVGRLLLNGNEPWPSFGLVTEGDEGVAVMVNGSLVVTVTSGTGAVAGLSSQAHAGWADLVLSEPFASISIGAPASPPDAGRSDLREGTVSAGGLVLVPREEPAATEERPRSASPVVFEEAASPPTEPVARASGRETTVPAGEAVGPAEAAALASSQPAGPAVEPAGLATSEVVVPAAEAAESASSQPAGPGGVAAPPVMVKGVSCSRGHFNPPGAKYCSSCGTSMVHLTLKLVDGPRPPLGILVLSDGSVVPVDSDLVIGREPGTHQDVVEGRARAVVVDDPQLSVSRCHAAVRLQDWDVHVVDLGSQNGTAVAAHDSTQATAVSTGEVRKIDSGARVVLGTYTLTFNSSFH